MVGQHSRGEGVQATGFHLQQAVPPVCLGYTEIVHGASKDPEGGVLQHKVLAIGVQPGPPVCEPGRDQTAPVQPTKGKAVGKPRRSPSAVSRGTGRDRLPLLLHRPSAFLRRACFQGVQKRLPPSNVATTWKQSFFGTTDSSGPAAREEQAEWGCSQERDKQNSKHRDGANKREDEVGAYCTGRMGSAGWKAAFWCGTQLPTTASLLGHVTKFQSINYFK